MEIKADVATSYREHLQRYRGLIKAPVTQGPGFSGDSVRGGRGGQFPPGLAQGQANAIQDSRLFCWGRCVVPVKW